MEEALALVADVLRRFEQTAFHGAEKMSMQQYATALATLWPRVPHDAIRPAAYEQYISEAQGVAERSVARLSGQQHGERYAQALFDELLSFAEFARLAGNLLSNPLKDAIWRARAQEIAPLTFLKFGEALDRGAELLSSGTLTAEERKITARVIDLCRGSSKPAADASLVGKVVEVPTARLLNSRNYAVDELRRRGHEFISGRVTGFHPITDEHTIEYEEDETKHIEHDDGTIETVVVRPRGTSERRNLSRVPWRLKALSITPRDFCQKLRHPAAMLARRRAAVQMLLLCVGRKDDPLFLRAECDEAPALRALARLAKAGPDAVMLLVLEKAFGGPIDFRREMAVMLDA